MFSQLWAFLSTHPWQLAACAIAPILGFMATQLLKSYVPKKPGNQITRAFAGAVSAFFAFEFWRKGGSGDEYILAAAVFIAQPSVVAIWFLTARRFAPKMSENLTGSNGDLTIMPGLKIRNPRPHPQDDEDKTVRLTPQEVEEITQPKNADNH
jgi:hypothetical protein